MAVNVTDVPGQMLLPVEEDVITTEAGLVADPTLATTAVLVEETHPPKVPLASA